MNLATEMVRLLFHRPNKAVNLEYKCENYTSVFCIPPDCIERRSMRPAGQKLDRRRPPVFGLLLLYLILPERGVCSCHSGSTIYYRHPKLTTAQDTERTSRRGRKIQKKKKIKAYNTDPKLTGSKSCYYFSVRPPWIRYLCGLETLYHFLTHKDKSGCPLNLLQQKILIQINQKWVRNMCAETLK